MAAKKAGRRPSANKAGRAKTATNSASADSSAPAPPSAKVGSAGVAVSPINGATIPLGAHPGNTGGKPGRSGRIKERVKRDLLRASLKHGAVVLEAIASGDLVERRQVRLLDVLPHIVCPNCGEAGMAPREGRADALLLTFDAQASASPSDRRNAIDTMLKYSVGLKEELTVIHPEVQQRLERTVALIGSRETWRAAELLEALSAVWRQ